MRLGVAVVVDVFRGVIVDIAAAIGEEGDQFRVVARRWWR
jgi:hypothetical protein